jgi:hypothetical protein
MTRRGGLGARTILTMVRGVLPLLMLMSVISGCAGKDGTDAPASGGSSAIGGSSSSQAGANGSETLAFACDEAARPPAAA